MSEDSIGIFLYAESSLHAGSGSTLGHVDLPIQREAHSGHPVVYGSGVKGALRDHCRPAATDADARLKWLALFGPESDEASKHGGLGIFQEARVVLFPVRSFRGTFAWVTSPMVLRRLQRDLQAVLGQSPAVQELARAPVPWLSVEDRALFDSGSGLRMGAAENEDRVVLEEYVFQPDADNRALAASFGEWFSTFALPQTDAAYVWWRTKLGKDLVVVSDDVFTYFVRMHTEIQTHVRIDPGTGTVDKRSGPRDEEALPPDTLLCTTVTIPTPLEGPARQAFPNGASDAATYLKGHLTRSFQLCGDRSLGKGVARPTVIDRGTARPSAGGGKQ